MSEINLFLTEGINPTLCALQTGMQIALIATFPVKICHPYDKVQEVLVRPELQSFDWIPVLDAEKVVGVLHRETLQTVGSVAEVMQPLEDSNLIAANAGLLTFVEESDRHPYRLLVDGDRLVGIVTWSDLEKFAVRPLLFSLITGVELILAEWLRQKYPNDKWLQALSEGRQNIINERCIGWDIDKTAMDKIAVTEFCDKRQAAIKLGAFSSKTAAKKKLWDVEWLRHAVMHSANYALTVENAQRTARGTRYAREIIESLRTLEGWG